MPVAGSRNLEREQHWRRLFAEFQTAGLTIAAFCRANNTVPSQFYDWKKRLAERDAKAPSADGGTRVRKAARAKAIAAKLRTKDARSVEFAEVKVVETKNLEHEAPLPPPPLQAKAEPFVLEVALPSGTLLRFSKNCPADFLEAVLTIMEVR
jgi:transposase-like protein